MRRDEEQLWACLPSCCHLTSKVCDRFAATLARHDHRRGRMHPIGSDADERAINRSRFAADTRGVCRLVGRSCPGHPLSRENTHHVVFSFIRPLVRRISTRDRAGYLMIRLAGPRAERTDGRTRKNGSEQRAMHLVHFKQLIVWYATRSPLSTPPSYAACVIL